MDKLVDFRSVDQRIKYKCSWSPTHRRPWCFKHFLEFIVFLMVFHVNLHTRHATLLLCSLALAHTRHATLW